MKKINLLLGAAVVAVSFTSCKSEAEKNAEVTFDRYEKYVDSVNNIAVADAQANWESIDATYNEQTSNAEAALVDAGDKTNAENRVEKAKAKYAELKAKMEAVAAKATESAANNPANRK